MICERSVKKTSYMCKAHVKRDSSGPATLEISVGLQQYECILKEYLNLKPPYGRLLEFKTSKLRPRFLKMSVLC